MEAQTKNPKRGREKHQEKVGKDGSVHEVFGLQSSEFKKNSQAW